MPKLVLQSHRQLEVGKIYRGLHDPWAQIRPEQMFMVLSESTPEEWIECVVSFGGERAWAEMLSVLDPYFYEIITD